MRYRLGILILIAAVLAATPALADRFSMGSDVIVGPEERVDSAVSLGGDIVVRGRVDDDVVGIGGDVVVESGGQVRGDVVSLGGDIRIEEGGLVRGDAVGLGGEVRVDPGGILLGKAVKEATARRFFKHLSPGAVISFLRDPIGPFAAGWPFKGIFKTPFGFGGWGGGTLLRMLLSVLIALFIGYVFGDGVNRMAWYAEHNLPWALLTGMVAVVLLPFVALALIITIIGIPVVVILAFVLAAAYLYGATAISLWVGRIIPEAPYRPFLLNILIGTVVVQVLRAIPVAGFIFGFVYGVAALGVVIAGRRG